MSGRVGDGRYEGVEAAAGLQGDGSEVPGEEVRVHRVFVDEHRSSMLVVGEVVFGWVESQSGERRHVGDVVFVEEVFDESAAEECAEGDAEPSLGLAAGPGCGFDTAFQVRSRHLDTASKEEVVGAGDPEVVRDVSKWPQNAFEVLVERESVAVLVCPDGAVDSRSWDLSVSLDERGEDVMLVAVSSSSRLEGLIEQWTDLGEVLVRQRQQARLRWWEGLGGAG